jgi:hypothetical protein
LSASSSAEKFFDPLGRATGDVGDLGARGRGKRVKHEQVARVVPHVDAIQCQHVDMDIHAERAVRSLNCGHGSGRQNEALQMHGCVGHAATETRRAKTTLLARQRHDLGQAALATDEVQATLLQDAAAQELVEFVHHEAR